MGHGLLKHFLLNSDYTNLNHGSFGSTPECVLAAQRRWQDHVESNPDRWFRFHDARSLFGSIDEVRSKLASYIGAANPDDVVLVDGASGGVNAVLRSVRLPESSAVLHLNTAYQMVKNTMNYIHDHDGWETPLEVNITIPSSDAEVVQAVESALDKNPSVRLAVFSHITSIPAVILPVKELTQACKQRGVMVLIDGAHALGQIPIRVEDIGADFYVANGHKWLYSPKGSALIWVAPSKQDLVLPNVISGEGQGPTAFQLQFSYTGTKDYSPFLAMSAALDFRSKLGGDKLIMEYMHSLASRGGSLLAASWGTGKLVDDAQIGAMVNVRLPDAARFCCTGEQLSNNLLDYHGTWVPVYPWQGSCYVRISAQVYNDLSDFMFLAEAVKDVLATSCKQHP
jgi:selenocysteine lyase/cysteine desulfurase